MTKSKAQMPLYEQVVKTIQDQIVSGIYQNGDLLPSEKELIDSMGVSRITIRKALSILSEMGFIATSKGRGSIVILDVDDMASHGKFTEELKEYRRTFMEASQIRLMLEPEIAKKVAKSATTEQVAVLKNCLRLTQTGRPTNEFHMALVEVLDNKELTEIMNQLILIEESKMPQGVLAPEKQEKTGKILAHQHKRVLEAIEAGDEEFAYFYMKEHTKFVQQMYEEYFERLDNIR